MKEELCFILLSKHVFFNTGHWKATGQFSGKFKKKNVTKNLEIKVGGYMGWGGGGPHVPPHFDLQILSHVFLLKFSRKLSGWM